MTNQSSIDALEVSKFAHHAQTWWDKDGPLKTLHDINPARLAYIEQHTALRGKRVLDVGCGGGILSEGLARSGALVTGLDVEVSAIQAATDHAEAQALPIKYVTAPIETYQAEPFDCITCLEMLEHTAHPQVVIDHCARLLAPNGYLFLSTINRTLQAYASVVVAAEYVLSLLPRQTHDYKKFIMPSELSAMVRAAGLTVVGITGLAYNPFSRQASVQSSVKVNYLVACQRF